MKIASQKETSCFLATLEKVQKHRNSLLEEAP
jgi:hypothetical protein